MGEMNDSIYRLGLTLLIYGIAAFYLDGGKEVNCAVITGFMGFSGHLS